MVFIVSDSKMKMSATNHPELWLKKFPFSQPEGNKYTRGHALIYGGPVMTGAARLSSRAAQRIGAGVVTLATMTMAVPIYAASLESVIVRAVDTLDDWKLQLRDPKKNVVLIGPGMGLDEQKQDFILAALATRKPCVLDADALTIFAETPDSLFAALHGNCVLTPHEGEFVRLFGTKIVGEKHARVLAAARTAGCIILLKGSSTVIADPKGQEITNTTAPPWLATAGSGDVLAGMIVGLLAGGMQAFSAAAAAVWMHGQIATQFGPGLIAEDIIEGIPAALKDLSVMAGKIIVS